MSSRLAKFLYLNPDIHSIFTLSLPILLFPVSHQQTGQWRLCCRPENERSKVIEIKMFVTDRNSRKKTSSEVWILVLQGKQGNTK